MSLYILTENEDAYFIEQRAKREIIDIKSLNQKRIPTIVFENFEDVPEIFTDPKAVLLIAHGINDKSKEYVKLCNQNSIPVISLHDKNEMHYKCIYNSISDNDDITSSMIYRYFKSNGKERIAFFGFYAKSTADTSKVKGFYKVNPQFTCDDIYPIKSGFSECMESFWEHRFEYDGVYFPNDFMAIAFLNYFKSYEPEYLNDRFFLGFSDTIISRLFHISVSSVSYTFESVKSAVLQIYRSLINNKSEFNCISIDLKNIIFPRESTQKKPLTTSDTVIIRSRKSLPLKYAEAEDYDYKSDPAFKGIFELENLFINLKSIDLLIIYMFLKGYSNSTITSKLFLAPQSLNTHKNKYFKITGCKDKTEFIELVSKYVSIKHLEEYIKYISKDITDFSKY